MLILTVGFSSVSLILGFSFYRKYSARLNPESRDKPYARVADYSGRPIHLYFDYRQENTQSWEPVETQIDEIFHYGKDYFLKGNLGAGKTGTIYKRNRISNLKIDAEGKELQSLVNLLGESTRLASR